MPLSFPASWANGASEESFLATTGFEEDPDAKAVTGDDQLANEHTDNKGDVEHGQHDEPAKAGISVTSNDTDEMLATLIVGTVEAAPASEEAIMSSTKHQIIADEEAACHETQVDSGPPTESPHNDQDDDKENKPPQSECALVLEHDSQLPMEESQMVSVETVEKSLYKCSLCKQPTDISAFVGTITISGKGVCGPCNTRRTTLSREFGGMGKLSCFRDLDEQAQVDFWRADYGKRVNKYQLTERLSKSIAQTKINRSKEKTSGEFRPLQFWENQGYVSERIEKMTKDEDKKYTDMHGWLYKVDVESSSKEEVQEEVYKRLREQMNAAKGGSMLADVDDDVLSDDPGSKKRKLFSIADGHSTRKKPKRSRSNQSHVSNSEKSGSTKDSSSSSESSSSSDNDDIKTPEPNKKEGRRATPEKAPKDKGINIVDKSSNAKDKALEKKAREKAKQKQKDEKEKKLREKKKDKETAKKEKDKENKEKAQELKQKKAVEKRERSDSKIAEMAVHQIEGIFNQFQSLHDKAIKDDNLLDANYGPQLAGIKLQVQGILSTAMQVMNGNKNISVDFTAIKVRDLKKEIMTGVAKLKKMLN